MRFVFLAYIDDSGTRDKRRKFQLMTSVIIPDGAFRSLEQFAAGSIAAYIPDDKADKFREQFREFKGFELFGGYGPFDGIGKDTRFKIIELLLSMIRTHSFALIFGAVDKAEWEKQKSKSGEKFIYGASTVDDICFRACLKGVGEFVERNWPSTFALTIADDSTDKDIKNSMRSAFYSYRERVKPEKWFTPVPFLHDDMYFGDSRYSIGIQLADLCGYIISRHLENDSDPDIQRFYGIIERHVMYSRMEPEGKIIHPQR
jgi:hypothetical protein